VGSDSLSQFGSADDKRQCSGNRQRNGAVEEMRDHHIETHEAGARCNIDATAEPAEGHRLQNDSVDVQPDQMGREVVECIALLQALVEREWHGTPLELFEGTRLERLLDEFRFEFDEVVEQVRLCERPSSIDVQADPGGIAYRRTQRAKPRLIMLPLRGWAELYLQGAITRCNGAACRCREFLGRVPGDHHGKRDARPQRLTERSCEPLSCGKSHTPR